MYKDELKEKYTEKERAIFEIGFEKGISYMRDYTLMYAEKNGYSDVMIFQLNRILSLSCDECEKWLFHGLGLDDEEME